MGMRIRSLNNSFESAPMLLYIIIIGILGISMEKLIKYLERRLTSWQEKRDLTNRDDSRPVRVKLIT